MPRKKTTDAAPILHIEPAILDRTHAAAFLSISEAAFEREVAQRRAPAARKITPGRVGWLVAELREFASSLPPSDLLPPENSGYGRAGKPSESAAAAVS